MNSKLYKLMNWPKIEEIVYSESDNPHALLGPHKVGRGILFQIYYPSAKEITLKVLETSKGKTQSIKMECADEEGFFAALYTGKTYFDYWYCITLEDGKVLERHDPYAYDVMMNQKDIDNFHFGIHYSIYNYLGAHYININNVKGTIFRVWAPNALRVSVVGDFNAWDGRIHQMRRIDDKGIFELFIPETKPGDFYKFELKLKNNMTFLKADPYCNAMQLRPDTASVISEVSDFVWEDKKFINSRPRFQNAERPMSIYELYLGSFLHVEKGQEFTNYKDIAEKLVAYVKEMKYTHVELMPIMEHPLDESWGYQVIGLYAPTARYGNIDDLKYLINELHKANIGVILDWVPAHFPKDDHGLSGFDGTFLYENSDPKQRFHPHWGTLTYQYNRKEVSNYLIANGLYWVEQFHADGIRMDAVASMLYLDYGRNNGEWTPNIYGGNENLDAIEFIKHFNSILKTRNPGVLSIAEDSTAFPMLTGDLNDGGLGFDFKWNMGYMNDFLGYIKYDPYFRSHHHNELTFSMIYAYCEKFLLPFSHDEVVHEKGTLLTKMPGNEVQKFANLRLTLAYTFMHPGKKLLFMGQDFGEKVEWNEKRCIDWKLLEFPAYKGINILVKSLNELYLSNHLFSQYDCSPDGFEWLNHTNANESVLTFIRKGKKKKEFYLIVANFSGIPKQLNIGVPLAGKYKEILNTDDKIFGGEGFVNPRVKNAVMKSADQKPYSISMKLAATSLSVFKYSE